MIQQHRRFQPILMILLLASATFLSSCNQEITEICAGRYDRTVVSAIAELEPLQRAYEHDRSLASIRSDATLTGQKPNDQKWVLAEQDREKWQSWAEQELTRVESYVDWANFHRDESPEYDRLRRRLTDTANRLVAFHGYSQEGRLARMLATLRSIEGDRVEIQASVCKSR